MPKNDLLWNYVHQCLEDSEEWFPATSNSIAYHTLALCGEVGELANLVKKIERGSRQWDEKTINEFRMELADVFTYLLNLTGFSNTDLAEAYEVKRAYNIRRFGSGPKQP